MIVATGGYGSRGDISVSEYGSWLSDRIGGTGVAALVAGTAIAGTAIAAKKLRQPVGGDPGTRTQMDEFVGRLPKWLTGRTEEGPATGERPLPQKAMDIVQMAITGKPAPAAGVGVTGIRDEEQRIAEEKKEEEGFFKMKTMLPLSIGAAALAYFMYRG